MQDKAYHEASYYERWAISLAHNLLESGVLSQVGKFCQNATRRSAQS